MKWPLPIVATAMLLCAAPANASPETDFLNLLTDSGIVLYDSDQALRVGHGICAALETTNGKTVAENLYQITLRSEIPDREMAGAWVTISGATLCPWTFHPERAITPPRKRLV